MGNNLKDLAETASKYVTESLDAMKDFIDRTADEMAKADVIGANRRLANTMIESTKETVHRLADTAKRQDAYAAMRELATGTLDGARDAVRVASEETQRINLVGTSSRVTQESLELMRRQLELSFEASREVGEVVNRLMPFRATGMATDTRPVGVVTRVEIESDGTIHAEPTAGAAR